MTLDELLIRIRRHSTEDGDCLIWHGATTGVTKVPYMGWSGKAMPVRRAIWTRTRRIPPNHLLVASCGDAACVAPKHIQCISRSQLSALSKARGTMSTGMKHTLATTKSARNRSNVKLSMDIARAMRQRYAETDNAALVAREFGVSHGHAHKIVRGMWWRESSPWAI